MNVQNFPPSWQQKRSGSRCDKLVKITLFGICLLNMVVRSTSGSNMPKFWVCLGTVDLYRIYANKSILESQTIKSHGFGARLVAFTAISWSHSEGQKSHLIFRLMEYNFPEYFHLCLVKLISLILFYTVNKSAGFFFPNILVFVVDLRVFGLLGLRGLLFSLENLLCCC